MRIPPQSVCKLARSFFIAHFVDLQNSLHDDEIFFHRLVPCTVLLDVYRYIISIHTYSTDKHIVFVCCITYLSVFLQSLRISDIPYLVIAVSK